jgi:Fic family protein
MRTEDFSEDAPGDLVVISRSLTPNDLDNLQTGERGASRSIHAFVPMPLPPRLAYEAQTVSAIGRAMYALGQLDQVVQDLVNPYILVRPFLRREAVASSRIEGTRADVADLALFEATEQAEDQQQGDVREVENYLKALEYALAQPQDRRVTVSLIRELHQLLLKGVRGSLFEPGQVRTRQNYIGTRDDRIEAARYIPPPPGELPGLLLDLERFINTDSTIPELVRIALVHYQFEAIHPFLDGNGRLGRLLIALLLQRWGLMRHPVADISAYVLEHRDKYISGLLRVSQQGDWLGWIEFFLSAFESQAHDAFRRGKRLLELKDRYENALASETKSKSLDLLINHLFERLTITVRQAEKLLDVTFPTAQRFVERLEALQIVEEATGRRRDRIYRAREIIAVLDSMES